MAQFFTDDFSGTWTDRMTPGSSFTTDWTVSSGDLTASAGSGDVGGRTLSTVSDDDDVEILTSYEALTITSYCHAAMIRGSGGDGTPTAYTIALFNTRIRLYKFLGSNTPTTIASTSCTLTNNTKYWVRFRVNADDLTATVWADGGSEGSPIATVSFTNDTSITASGWSGPFMNGFTGAKWYQFGWGTNGDTAPSSAPSTAASIAFRRAFPLPILNF